MLDRINAAGAGVTASFDAATQVVMIESATGRDRLDIDSNGTGLFAALNMPEGRVDPEAVEGGLSKRQSYRIAEAFNALAVELNALFDDRNFQEGLGGVRSARATISSLVRATLESAAVDQESLFGVRFDLSAASNSNGRLVDVDQLELAKQLQRRGDPVKDIFAGDEDRSGLIGKLYQTTLGSLRGLNRALGIKGDLVDTFV